MRDRAAGGAAHRRPRPPATRARPAPVTGRGAAQRGETEMATVLGSTSGRSRASARLAAAGVAALLAGVAPARADTTERASVGPGGRQADDGNNGPLSISADGRFVAFVSVATNLVPGDTNGWADVFVRDRETGRTERASVGPGGRQGDWHSGGGPALSARGRLVAFSSLATNLVPGDTNRFEDVFVRDRQTGRTTRVSTSSSGEEA